MSGESFSFEEMDKVALLGGFAARLGIKAAGKTAAKKGIMASLKSKAVAPVLLGGAAAYGLTAGMPKNKPLTDSRYTL